jgi:predicted GNAT superfamily acetyltransferase
MEYRVLESVDELQQVVDLEIAVWGLEPRDAVPMNIMRSMTMHGGVIMGCCDNGRMVGMSLAFPARHNKHWVLWSHMAGVEPAYQGQGIGFGLKQAQRNWALEHGYREIRWTFDPLQRGNAHFNLRLLGATASIYHTDYYGVMTDAINRDSASDRVEACWKLTDRRVQALAAGKPPAKPSHTRATFLLRAENGSPVAVPTNTNQQWLLVEIPRHRSQLSLEAVSAWRLSLRSALQEAFARGYTAVDFVEDDAVSAYVLRAGMQWYLYVLRCADESLYTGITPDLSKRLAAHQSGRGAAYTSSRRPVAPLAAWQFPDRSSALKAEAAFKQMTRAAKLRVIAEQKLYQGAVYIDVPVLLE